MLGWAVAGTVEWCRDGTRPPTAVLALTEEYLGDEDGFGQWLAECCERVCPQILALAPMQMWRREVARHVEKIIGPRV